MKPQIIALCLTICVIDLVSSQSVGFGIFTVQLPNNQEENFCIKYYPELYNLTSNKSEAVTFDLNQLYELPQDANTCPDEEDIDDLDPNQIALIPTTNKTINGNCTMDQRAQIIAKHKALGVLADSGLSSRFNSSDYEVNDTTNFLVAAFYKHSDVKKIMKLKEEHKSEATFVMYSPEMEKMFDFSLVLILMMAIFTVSVGSAWSGYTKKHLLDGKKNVKREVVEDENEDQERVYLENDSNSKGTSEDISLQVSPVLIMVFVCMMCLMLLLLYFFFDKLVYMIIGMFCFASFIAVYSCLEPIVMYSYEVCPRFIFQFPSCNLYCCVINLELRQFLIMSFSLAITAVWLFFRKAHWAWILQDFLGVLFSLNMLKTLRLPSLKVITVLLCTLFIYDIFFVFITPLLTKDGKSVMVEVATGGDEGGEQLPMVLKVPHFNAPTTVCYHSYSMLGFGDILVPGLLVSFCHAYDLQKESRFWTYWAITNIFYALGMVATFVSLFVMNSAQPALLYLVPFTLIPIFIVSFFTGDFADMWQGDFHTEVERKEITVEANVGETGDAHGSSEELNRQESNEAK